VYCFSFRIFTGAAETGASWTGTRNYNWLLCESFDPAVARNRNSSDHLHNKRVCGDADTVLITVVSTIQCYHKSSRTPIVPISPPVILNCGRYRRYMVRIWNYQYYYRTILSGISRCGILPGHLHYQWFMRVTADTAIVVGMLLANADHQMLQDPMCFG